ncbi:Formamidase [Dacryopinax primogenitus]|uniref:Formamidase n=1 Tax=Dacryopinax primogenitus (strain DJM 731) TaxID=1858805 RepID=M5G1R8_DACPD|nr:Formamidase [Dacryopinax primogenitus]EJT99826.1 Formamidase [Dacryopinax primogenitus]
MAPQYTIHQRQCHLKWDNSIPPVATVASGSVVNFDCLDASNGQINASSTIESVARMDFSQVDQVNGPIFVEDAEPGDVLEVEFLELETADWGWTANIPGFGALADVFEAPALKIWKIEKDENGQHFTWFKEGKIRILTAPFCGEIGVARGEKGAFSTIPPYRTGGNIDTKHITLGTKIYLPIEVKGALFSVGDGHAAQGDGECCGTAIETPMKVSVRLTIHKNMPYVKEPSFLTPGPLASNFNTGKHYSTLGIDPNLREATKKAVTFMVDYLESVHDLTRVEAYMLCSVCVDLKMCEVVDMPNYAIGAFFPLSVFV